MLDVAIRLIAERGVYGTRIEDITERSDLGKGAFYNYFESKDRLIAELVAQGVELLDNRYLAPVHVRAPADRVAAVIAAHEAFFDDHPAYVVLFHQARGLASVRATASAALASVFTEYLRRTGAAIVAPEDRGQLSDAALIDLAAVLAGAIAGARSFRLSSGLDASSPAVTDVLTAGVSATLAALPRTPST
ncbi:MAG: TetR/AcrR family transcriptional regulator [Myxococcales bacterium]|nr:TetR/AcrR family transcriptional regulator [Myxococcales bacterium]